MTSKIKVDNINKVSDDSNIINKCGSTITLGASGDSIALASGASQTGFGRTGTVDWQTGSIKTSTFTAANGEGYFCNTAGGEFTVNLPAGVAGAIVSVQDYNNTFDSNKLTVEPNGSEKINGGSAGDPVELSTEGRGVTFVYIDSTVGWRSVQDNDFATPGASAQFIVATGGTITTVDTNFKVHTFTGPGTFTVCSTGNVCGSNEVSYMVIAAGAGGGGAAEGGGGGAGAGGFREGKTPQCTYTSSPLACTSGSNNGIPVTAQGYPIVVGAGGTGGGCGRSPGNIAGTNGGNSSALGITSTGGGTGTHVGMPYSNTLILGSTGGSGGGGAGGGPSPGSGAGFAGNTPPVSPPQGNTGGGAQPGPATQVGGGGGGASAVGVPHTPSAGGPGGAGVATSISGSSVTRAGGGGGGSRPNCGSSGGSGGGADGSGGNASFAAASGTANTGGGGGGGGRSEVSPSSPTGGGGGAGGSGVVMIRYKFQ